MKAFGRPNHSDVRTIGFLLPELDRGGPTFSAVTAAEHLPRDEYQGRFIVLGSRARADTEALERLQQGCIPISFLNLSGWSDLLSAGTERLLASEPADLVQTYGLRPDLAMYRQRARFDRPWISAVRGMLRSEYSFRYGGIAGAFFARIHYISLRHADAALVLSRGMKEECVSQGVPADRIEIIPNGIDADWGAHLLPAEPCEVRRIRKLALIGALIPRKRPEWALRALSALPPGLRDSVHLDIVGSGPMEASLRRYTERLGLSGRVTFHGMTADVAGTLSSTDLLLLTSGSEGMPRVVLEALALGKPCLVPDLPGILELISEDNGFVFASRSEDSLRITLQRVLSSEHRISPLRIRERVLRDYSARRATFAMTTVYRRLLGTTQS